MSDPKHSSTSSSSGGVPPPTAHNWALVARHLDMRSCLTLMATCRELYHSLAYALPKWHFEHQFRWVLAMEMQIAASDADFACEAYKDNEAWLVERLFVFARLGLWMDVRLPLLQRARADPRMHTTVRVLVPRGGDAVTAIERISTRTPATDGEHYDEDCGGSNRDESSANAAGEGRAMKRAKTWEGLKLATSRGPAAMSWAVDIWSDAEARRLQRHVAALAEMTRVDKLRVCLRCSVTRLAINGVKELKLRCMGLFKIGRLETDNVHTLDLRHVSQAVLDGKCREIDTLHLSEISALTSAPALSGARTVLLLGTHGLPDWSLFRHARSFAFTGMGNGARLEELAHVRCLELKTCGGIQGGTIELPHVEELSLGSVAFVEPAELHCPKVTKLYIGTGGPLIRAVTNPFLERLRISAMLLPRIEAQRVRHLRVTLPIQRQHGDDLLTEGSITSCRAVDAWRRRVTGELIVELMIKGCTITLCEPPSPMETAVDRLLAAMTDDHGPHSVPVDASILATRPNVTVSVDSMAPLQSRLSASAPWNLIQELHLYNVDLDGWVVDGVRKVCLSSCTGQLVVRRAKCVHTWERHYTGSPLILTVEDCDEVDTMGEATLAKVARVGLCSVTDDLIAESPLRIGEVHDVGCLELVSCALAHTSLEDVAQYGCHVLRILDLDLPDAALLVPSAMIWERPLEERFAILQRQCHHMEG